MCNCLTFLITTSVHDRLATDALCCRGYFSTSSILSFIPLQSDDPSSDAQLRHRYDWKADANVWLVIAVFSFLQPLSSITHDITSHLDCFDVLYRRYPSREGTSHPTPAWLHSFLLLFVGLHGPEPI